MGKPRRVGCVRNHQSMLAKSKKRDIYDDGQKGRLRLYSITNKKGKKAHSTLYLTTYKIINQIDRRKAAHYYKIDTKKTK